VASFTGEHEHERAAGAWHAEWEPLGELLALTGGAVAAARALVEDFEVDADRLRANVRPETTSEARGAVAPEDYLGAADALVDRALAWFRKDLG
jgi:3-carboxy-cis,cis-muconate cycloisomerase